MKRLFILGFFFISLFFISPYKISAQTCNDAGVRCAECDACGYCRGRQAPGNWENCTKCLYPGISTNNPVADTTLLITGTIGEKARAITPALGRYYTQLGCINTNMDSFTNPSAAGGLLNFILNKLIFPIVGVLAFLSLIYGAFLLATAQSNPEQLARGKSYVVGALVGLLFVLGVLFIVGFIAGDILKIPGFSSGGSNVKLRIHADTAMFDGKPVYPILGVLVDGVEVSSKTLAAGTQEISLNLPKELDIANPAEANTVSFTMKNDQCYTISTTRNSTCCDPAIVNSPSVPQQRKDQCADPTNYNGDVNLHISQISIEDTPCKNYTVNGIVTTKNSITVSGLGTIIGCTII